MKPAKLAEPVFVGRDRELEKLLEHLTSTLEGKGATVFISGEAGSGKTRLASEFLRIVKEKEVRILSGWCMSNAATPYFPFVEALNHYFSPLQGTGTKAALPENLGITGWLIGSSGTGRGELGLKSWLKGSKQTLKRQEIEALSPEIRKDVTFAAVTKLLLSLASDQPTVLFLEDVHWADSASIALIYYLSRAIASSRLLLLATFRLEELSPDAEGHPHPLVETMRLMRREGLYSEIPLPSLTKSDVEKLTESMVGGDVTSGLIERLTKDSQGNPLFTVESVRMLLASGGLVREGNEWRLALEEMGIPTKVRDIILRRFGILDSSQRRLLDLASVIGEEFDPSLLGRVFSLDKLHILETLAGTARTALLVSPQDSTYRFTHAKLREVLYEEIPTPLRREYHARIAQVIDDPNKPLEVLPIVDLAFHYAQAGNREKSVKYSLIAGHDALRRFSNTEAAKHFTYILNTVSDDARFGKESAIALEGLGDAYLATGLFEKAVKNYESLYEISDLNSIKLRSLRKAMAASFRRGDFSHTIELAEKSEGRESTDRLEYARIRMYKARTVGFKGNPEESMRELRDCLHVFEEENSLQDIANVLREISVGESSDRPEDALTDMQRAITIYERLGDTGGQVEGYFWLGMPYFDLGRHKEALKSWAKVVEIGRRTGNYDRMAWAEGYSSFLLESVYDFKEALAHSLNGLNYSEYVDSHYTKTMIYVILTMNYAQLGDLEHAEEYYNRMTKLFEASSRDASKLLHAGVVRASAVYLSARKRWDEANSCFEESVELYKGAALTLLHEAMMRRDYAEALLKQGRVADAKTQIEEALRLYERLGNATMVANSNALLARIEKNPIIAS